MLDGRYPAAAGHCGGARNKLLEYLARGRTIVSTPEGVRGLEEVADWPGVVITDDDPGAYGDAIARVLDEGGPRLADDRRLVRERLRWDRLAQELDSSTLDVVLARYTGHRLSVNFSEEKVFSDPIVLVCGPQHSLAKKSRLAWKDLNGVPWILPPSGSATFTNLEQLLERRLG